MAEHLLRQSDVIPMSLLATRINIIGAGGIGSHVSTSLARMGFMNQCVWDHDDVSMVNMNTQGYYRSHVGKPKVVCLREVIREITGQDIQIRCEKYIGQHLEGIVITALDSMAARTVVWEKIKNNRFVTKLIDPRMSLAQALCYTMDPRSQKDQGSYEKTLYSDENSVQEPCTAKSIMFTASLISGLVGKIVKNVVCGETYPRVVQWNIANDSFMSWPSQKEGADGTRELSANA